MRKAFLVSWGLDGERIASVVVAAAIDRRFGIKGKAYGQKGPVRGFPLK